MQLSRLDGLGVLLQKKPLTSFMDKIHNRMEEQKQAQQAIVQSIPKVSAETQNESIWAHLPQAAPLNQIKPGIPSLANGLNERINRFRQAGIKKQPTDETVFVMAYQVTEPTGEVRILLEDEEGGVFEINQDAALLGSIFSKIVNAVTNTVKDVGGAISDAAKVVATPVRVIGKTVGNTFNNLKDGDGLTKSIKSGVKDALQDEKKFYEELGEKLNELVRKINVLNPATVLLRNGVLASAKLNLFGISETLRYAYLNEAQAVAAGIDIGKWNHAKSVQTGLAKAFRNWGGDDSNLRAAILSGKGNEDKKVSLSGIGQLGLEPGITAAITAASAFIGKIALDLQPVKDLFKKEPAPAPVPEQEREFSYTNYGLEESIKTSQTTSNPELEKKIAELESEIKESEDKANDKSQNNWLIPVSIGAGVLALGGIALFATRNKNTAPKAQANTTPSLSGVKRTKTKPHTKSAKPSSKMKKSKSSLTIVNF